jgi:hypothetical protein
MVEASWVARSGSAPAPALSLRQRAPYRPLLHSHRQAAQVMLPPGVPPASPGAGLSQLAVAPTAAAGGDGAAEGSDNDVCVVCWEERRGVVLVPCGHLVLCRRCANDLMAPQQQLRRPLCPICRQGVAVAQDVFG